MGAGRTGRRRARVAFAAVLLGMLLVACPGRARAADPSQTYELRFDPLLDVAVTAGFTTYVVATELAKARLVPDRCRWCDRSSSGQDRLNGLDRSVRDALRWDDTAAADRLSNVSGFVLLPTLMIGGTAALGVSNHRADAVATDLGIVLESVSISLALVQTVKLSSARERPYAHFSATLPVSPDSRLSFHSGHTSLAFTLAVASGTVAELRGYRYAYLLWAAGLPLAAATGYSRIAADRHYATDVLGGALLGAAVGAAVPLVFHGRKHRLRVTPALGPTALGLSVSGVF